MYPNGSSEVCALFPSNDSTEKAVEIQPLRLGPGQPKGYRFERRIRDAYFLLQSVQKLALVQVLSVSLDSATDCRSPR